MSTSPNAHGGRGDQTATARSNSRSRMRHGAGERMSKQRIQTRPSDVQQLRDLRPVLLAWLKSKDAFFSPLEAATGLDREQTCQDCFRVSSGADGCSEGCAQKRK
uniref:Uncharacterized protein n=1 Tax=Meloidogyne floridensis TaxID=298350 RepID=A0A915NU53_9BILA